MHIPYKGLWSEILFLIPRFASEAVIVFFVLSGYLVGGRTLERAMAGKFNGITYAIDRGSRIWLPLIPAVIATWAVSMIRGRGIDWVEGLGNILAVQGVLVPPMSYNTSLWSLSYEVWFYVAALGVGLLLKDRGRKVLLPILLLTLVFGIFLTLGVTNLFIWILGALAYFLNPGKLRWYLLAGGFFLAVIAALLSVLAVDLTSTNFRLLEDIASYRRYFLFFLGLGVALSLPPLVRLKPTHPWLSRADLCGTSLAAWSYSLYLIHRPILELWSNFQDSGPNDRLDSTTITLFLIKVTTCVIGALIFWLAFEKQTDKLRRRLKKLLSPAIHQSRTIPTNVP